MSGRAASVSVAPVKVGTDPLSDREVDRYSIRDSNACRNQIAGTSYDQLNWSSRSHPLGACMASETAMLSQARLVFVDDVHGHTVPNLDGKNGAGFTRASRRNIWAQDGDTWTLRAQESRASYNLYAVWRPFMRFDVTEIGAFEVRPSRSVNEFNDRSQKSRWQDWVIAQLDR